MLKAEVQQADLQIIFQGEAVEDGAMDVRELAPSLLALGDVFSSANAVLNGEQARVVVRVTSQFEHGSFDIRIRILQTILEQAKALLLGKPVTEIKEIAERLILGVKGGVSIISLLKWLKNRRPEKETVLENGLIRVEIGGDFRDVDQVTLTLSRDRATRSAIERFVAPVRQEGIDSLHLRLPGSSDREEVVERVDAEAFRAVVDERQLLADSTYEVAQEVVKAAFDPALKWKFSNGQSRFDAAVMDHEFWTALQQGRYTFGAGDLLKARIRTQSWLDADGRMKSENTVVEVLGHIPRKRQWQGDLFDGSHSPEDEKKE